MSELNKTSPANGNPLIDMSAEIADAVLDKQERENAQKEADKYHHRLTFEEVIDGGGRTKESQLAQILAEKKSI